MQAIAHRVPITAFAIACACAAAAIAQTPQGQAVQTLSLASGAEVRYPATWVRSPVEYRNATELIVVGKAPGRADAEPTAQARVLITTEPRLDHQDALRRLVDIARERDGKTRFLAIGGWPAVEVSFVEPVATRGQQTPPLQPGEAQAPITPALAQRATTAVATGSEVVRFDASLDPNADPALLTDAQSIARSATFRARQAPAALQNELRRLSNDPRLRRAPQVEPPVALAPARAPAGAVPQAGARAAGAAVRVQGGVGELEVVASADTNAVAIASNGGLSFSTNRGATFAAGNTGVFGLNDPSLARGATGAFYLGVIAFPNGTAAQLNQTGCTNAVSRSTNGGSTFTAQGFSALCPRTGAGICFPDQEHIAADSQHTASAGNDQVYAVWRNFVPSGPPPATCGGIGSGFPTASISCSQNSGTTWTARAAIPGAGDFPRVAVAPDGQVFVVSVSGNSVLLNRFSSCTSGLNASPGFPVTVATLTAPVACPMPGLDRCNNGNTLSSPTVAPDQSLLNRIFVAFAESDNAGGERVVVTRSANGGLTFPSRRTLSGATSARRFMPWACATRGNAYVGWYDRTAAVGGATNDLTNYFLGEGVSASTGVNAGFVRNLSNNADPECASGWPCAPRSTLDSESCTTQPQLAGVCAPGGARCDFSTLNACPAGAVCTTGLGCPKYGDYSGIACSGDFVFTAWASATAPAGVVGAPAGLNVFASTERVATTNVTTLTVNKILEHPDHNHLRLFNLKIDGTTVRANVNAGTTGPQVVTPGAHTVSETGGTGTSLSAFTRVFGGSCAANGTVTLAPFEAKVCTITNYDNFGGCTGTRRCCEPGSGTQGCQRCVASNQQCP